MARMIDKLPPAKQTGRPPAYPWDDWFNGSPWAILWGEDYRCAHRSMRARIYTAARERTDGTVQIRNLWEDGEQIGLAFQFMRFPDGVDVKLRRRRFQPAILESSS